MQKTPQFPNIPRVMNAACSIASTEEELRRLEDSLTDAIVTKTATLLEILPRRQIYHYDGIGAVNNFRLANPGFEYYQQLQFSKTYIISIAGDIESLQTMLDEPTSADMFEINVSCPNAANAQLHDLNELNIAVPYGVKLQPMIAIKDLRKAVKQILSLSHLPNYVVCSNTYAGLLDGRAGGISGKYLKPISLMNTKFMHDFLPREISVIGCGGISTVTDAKQYVTCGAAGVQIATDAIEHGLEIFEKIQKADLWAPRQDRTAASL